MLKLAVHDPGVGPQDAALGKRRSLLMKSIRTAAFPTSALPVPLAEYEKLTTVFSPSWTTGSVVQLGAWNGG